MSKLDDEDFTGHHDEVVMTGDDLMTPILWSLSTMVAHTLNNLPSPHDLNGDHNDDFIACDPKSCAPCQGLYKLHEVDSLDQFLRPYVKTSGADWDWWEGDDAETGHLRWDWVTARTWPGSHDVYEDDGE